MLWLLHTGPGSVKGYANNYCLGLNDKSIHVVFMCTADYAVLSTLRTQQEQQENLYVY